MADTGSFPIVNPGAEGVATRFHVQGVGYRFVLVPAGLSIRFLLYPIRLGVVALRDVPEDRIDVYIRHPKQPDLLAAFPHDENLYGPVDHNVIVSHQRQNPNHVNQTVFEIVVRDSDLANCDDYLVSLKESGTGFDERPSKRPSEDASSSSKRSKGNGGQSFGGGGASSSGRGGIVASTRLTSRVVSLRDLKTDGCSVEKYQNGLKYFSQIRLL